jgi:hypothetical protein
MTAYASDRDHVRAGFGHTMPFLYAFNIVWNVFKAVT